MKLLLDQNLPRSLLDLIAPYFPHSAHIRDLGWERLPDEALWTKAKGAGFSLLTKDADFLDIALLRGVPPKVVLLSVGNIDNRSLRAFLSRWLPLLANELGREDRWSVVLQFDRQ